MNRVVDRIDIIGWSLVGIAVMSGVYACWIFNAILVSPLAHSIIKIFI